MTSRTLRICTVLIALTSTILGTGCESTGSSGPAATNPRLPDVASAALLRPGDSLGISLQGIPDPSQHEVQIDDEGTLSLPFIGGLHAAGLTSSELSALIRRTYVERAQLGGG